MASDRTTSKAVLLVLGGGLTFSASATALEDITVKADGNPLVALRKAVANGEAKLLEVDSSGVVRLAQFNDADWKKEFSKDPPAFA
jgi:hypothetical protein